jgi:hypothetical protein
LLAKQIAAAAPLGPAPMITTSKPDLSIEFPCAELQKSNLAKLFENEEIVIIIQANVTKAVRAK